MDYSLPGSFVHGIIKAGILEWVAILFSRGSSQPREQTHESCFTIVSPRKPSSCVCSPQMPTSGRTHRSLKTKASSCLTINDAIAMLVRYNPGPRKQWIEQYCLCHLTAKEVKTTCIFKAQTSVALGPALHQVLKYAQVTQVTCFIFQHPPSSQVQPVSYPRGASGAAPTWVSGTKTSSHLNVLSWTPLVADLTNWPVITKIQSSKLKALSQVHPHAICISLVSKLFCFVSLA